VISDSKMFLITARVRLKASRDFRAASASRRAKLTAIQYDGGLGMTERHFIIREMTCRSLLFERGGMDASLRHCEKRSDEAIHCCVGMRIRVWIQGLTRCFAASPKNSPLDYFPMSSRLLAMIGR
jgi:hypothetical protein